MCTTPTAPILPARRPVPRHGAACCAVYAAAAPARSTCSPRRRRVTHAPRSPRLLHSRGNPAIRRAAPLPQCRPAADVAGVALNILQVYCSVTHFRRHLLRYLASGVLPHTPPSLHTVTRSVMTASTACARRPRVKRHNPPVVAIAPNDSRLSRPRCAILNCRCSTCRMAAPALPKASFISATRLQLPALPHTGMILPYRTAAALYHSVRATSTDSRRQIHRTLPRVAPRVIAGQRYAITLRAVPAPLAHKHDHSSTCRHRCLSRCGTADACCARVTILFTAPLPRARCALHTKRSGGGGPTTHRPCRTAMGDSHALVLTLNSASLPSNWRAIPAATPSWAAPRYTRRPPTANTQHPRAARCVMPAVTVAATPTTQGASHTAAPRR